VHGAKIPGPDRAATKMGQHLSIPGESLLEFRLARSACKTALTRPSDPRFDGQDAESPQPAQTDCWYARAVGQRMPVHLGAPEAIGELRVNESPCCVKET